jgi:hypothetical protein
MIVPKNASRSELDGIFGKFGSGELIGLRQHYGGSVANLHDGQKHSGNGGNSEDDAGGSFSGCKLTAKVAN